MNEATEEENRIAKEVVDVAFHIHKSLGPGLLEGVYEACMADELRFRGFGVKEQETVPVVFNTRVINTAFRADIVVNDNVLIELKSIERLSRLQEAQILTYLKLTKIRLGLLINFNVPLIKDGIRRFYVSHA